MASRSLMLCVIAIIFAFHHEARAVREQLERAEMLFGMRQKEEGSQPDPVDEPKLDEPDPRDFAVASFNIENAVRFNALEDKDVKKQVDGLFIRMAACSVIFLQEYTDSKAWLALRSKFGPHGEHFRLIEPGDANLIDNGWHKPCKKDAFRVAILYDSRYWSKKDANLFVLTKVQNLGCCERRVTHIKNRAALHATLHPIGEPQNEVNFINLHLDAVDSGSRPDYHHEQFSQVLHDWIDLKLGDKRDRVLRISKLKLVIGGDTNYRAGDDEELLENLVKGGDEATRTPFVALGLLDARQDTEAVPTHFVQHLHEVDWRQDGGLLKRVGRRLARMGLQVGMLAPKRLDILASNLVITQPENIIEASEISDHSVVIAHFKNVLWRQAIGAMKVLD